MHDVETRFRALGLSEQKARETAANKKLSATLSLILGHVPDVHGLSKSQGTLLFSLASSLTSEARPKVGYVVGRVLDGDLLRLSQVQAAVKFVAGLNEGQSVDKEAFDLACGVGITVPGPDIQKYLTALLDGLDAELRAKRYKMLGSVLSQARDGRGICTDAADDLKAISARMKWANPAVVKDMVDSELLKRLGPKDERDGPPKKQPKANKQANLNQGAARKDIAREEGIQKSVSDESAISGLLHRMFEEGAMANMHRPGENPQISPALMEQHLKQTGGKVVTRFPPEPNGFLHIGHAKAINVDFGYAQVKGGSCLLRYDDTNPQKEEERYFTAILDNVRWLGFEPSAITHSSDHFQNLYECAISLIQRGMAYVDHSTAEEMHAQRGGDHGGERYNSPWRDRPVEESLAEFEKMKRGVYDEGKAVLRMKMDMQHPSPQFWDLVAYRVLKTEHYRTGSQWLIYPTYDFCHCLCDSFENITHSLCTLEFRMARESYYWLCDAVRVYKPVQWEYGRLNITNTVLSKRKLLKLVDSGVVANWDDPRLYTLVALRRRGFPPQAINAFVRELGVTTNYATIKAARLENKIRDYLNETTDRVMAILDPVPLTIVDLAEDYLEHVDVPNHPRIPARGKHLAPFTRTVYIDREDFRPVGSKDFYRLAPGKSVGLLNVAHPIQYSSHEADPETGRVTSITCTYDKACTGKKPQTYIQWVSADKCKTVEARIYNPLFLHENPGEVEGGFMNDINPDSLVIKPNTKVEPHFFTYIEQALKTQGAAYCRTADANSVASNEELKSVETLKFQFLRIGFFCVDPMSDLEKGKVVLNKIVSLKEDSGKEAGK